MENGIKINMLQGSDILKNNLEGLSLKKQYNAVFANSLLLNKLKEIGLKINKDTTKDIITVKFDFGYTSQKGLEIKKQIKQIEDDNRELRADKKKQTDNKIKNDIQDDIRLNNKRKKELEEELKKESLTIEEIREKLYKDGFKLDWYKKIKGTDEYKIDKTINYKFWFRTPSKSRVGTVIFINSTLLNEIRDWQRMGLKLPVNKECKLVEMMAYESLTSSAIEDTIKINVDNILVISDLDSYFKCKCIVVKTNEKGECYTEHEERKVKNTLFDGQALLEDSLFKSNAGMILLRQHFFKAAGFRTYIQKFFKDYCIENDLDYNTFTVKDRYDNNILVKNIKMITTENAMKWEKFKDIGASFDYWKQKVKEDDCIFGICKTDHQSKYEDYQRMSYQMINTLDVNKEQLQEISKDTIQYINDLKSDNELYVNDFLVRNKNEINANEMIIDLYNHNNNFVKSQFFREYKAKDLNSYLKSVKGGKLLSKGDNLTVVGNPYTMLLHTVNKVPNTNLIVSEEFEDITLPVSDKFISVYTKQFVDKEYLAAFRNPHNSPNNIGYHRNFKHELMNKYFNFSKNIMAVNLIRTEEQDRKNGQDQDSDFNFVTNNKQIVESAERIFRNIKYPCIVNEIEQSKKKYINTINNIAKIDNGLAKSKKDIGKSSNLAQNAMSWYWNDENKELADIVCILSVLAQCAIDNSKRLYKVDVSKEINRLEKTIINVDNNNVAIKEVKPIFWKNISDTVSKNKLKECNCPMSFLENILAENIINSSTTKDTIDNKDFIKKIDGKANNKQIKNIEDKIKKYDDKIKEMHDELKKHINDKKDEDINNKIELLQVELINKISSLKLQTKTMQTLILKAIKENGADKKYKRRLLITLHKTHREVFLECFK